MRHPINKIHHNAWYCNLPCGYRDKKEMISLRRKPTKSKYNDDSDKSANNFFVFAILPSLRDAVFVGFGVTDRYVSGDTKAF